MKRLSSARPPVIPRPKVRPARSGNDLLRRYRRPAAAACLLLAAVLTLNLVASGQPSRRQVVVAAMDLPAGKLLNTTDLQMAEALAEPDDHQVFADLESVAGQRLAVAVPAGTVLRNFVLVGPQLLTGTPEGTVAVPLRLSDAGTVNLIDPGQLVDIVLTTGDGFEQAITSHTIAKAVPVLWVPAVQESGGMLGAAPSPTGGEGIIVVAAASNLSDDLAGAVSRGKVSAVLVN